ncbi:hypothetical protein TcWFU_010150 [Taenia crassiceps]|uniref:Uncharacterized protein n=1 Tax=Taenia crassiceps TaxID=6207 RepID=A0ABR4QBT4_9CEST
MADSPLSTVIKLVFERLTLLKKGNGGAQFPTGLTVAAGGGGDDGDQKVQKVASTLEQLTSSNWLIDNERGEEEKVENADTINSFNGEKVQYKAVTTP